MKSGENWSSIFRKEDSNGRLILKFSPVFISLSSCHPTVYVRCVVVHSAAFDLGLHI